MKNQYFYWSYFALGVMACLLAFCEMFYLSIGFRWLSLLILSMAYFSLNKTNDILFYLSLIFSGLAESMRVIGLESFQKEIDICFGIYSWVIVFLLRNSVNEVKFQVKKERIIPFIISTFLVVYLIFQVLNIVSPKIKNNIIYCGFFVFSFLVMLIYMGVLYISKHNKRYFWLLLLLITFVSSTLLGFLEALYYKNVLLKQFVFIIEISSHFFLLKFLITPDEDIDYI